MGLLDQLREGRPSDSRQQRYQTWSVLPDLLEQAIPSYKHGKIVLVRGEVIITGTVVSTSNPRHFYAVLHSEKTAADPASSGLYPYRGMTLPRPAGHRPIAMGMSRYRAEAETNYYMYPWVDWLEPAPEAVAQWISHVLVESAGKDVPPERFAAGI